MSTLQLTILRN